MAVGTVCEGGVYGPRCGCHTCEAHGALGGCKWSVGSARGV